MPLAALTAHAEGAAPQAQLDAGRQIYMTVCFACHQPTGLGMPNMFPPLAGSDWVNAPKPDRIIRLVLHGYAGPINVNGKPFTTVAPLMPPQPALSDQQIADVLTFVRSSFGNQAGPVSAQHVAAIRAAEKRATPWNHTDIQPIADR